MSQTTTESMFASFKADLVKRVETPASVPTAGTSATQRDRILDGLRRSGESAPPAVSPALVDWLREQTWSSFCQSLLRQYTQTLSLTPGQIKAAERMMARPAANTPEVFNASIRCGSCKAYHPTAADVRECYAGRDALVSAAPTEPEPVIAPEPEPVPEVPQTVDGTPTEYDTLQPGIYTLGEDDNDHRTYRVRVQSLTDDFAPGKTILEYLSGPNNDRDYKGFAFVIKGRPVIWKKHRDSALKVADAQTLCADPEAALRSVNCIRCDATLSVPSSIHNLMGKTCARKAYAL